MTKAQAIEATLLSMAIQHAEEQMREWEECVHDTEITIDRALNAAPQYKSAFASDLRSAKRRLPKEKKMLELWCKRLKALKS